nr:MAG TPA: hypothetical protein [Caudoviricetes sp.]
MAYCAQSEAVAGTEYPGIAILLTTQLVTTNKYGYE